MDRTLVNVKLTDAEKWPAHGMKHNYPQQKSWAESRGMGISVFADSEMPSLTWKCGTSLVWKVSPQTIREIIGDDAPSNFYVCEHQIQKETMGK